MGGKGEGCTLTLTLLRRQWAGDAGPFRPCWSGPRPAASPRGGDVGGMPVEGGGSSSPDDADGPASHLGSRHLTARRRSGRRVREEVVVVVGDIGGALVALATVDPVPWARAQMAFTLAFHIILVPLGV